MAPRNKPRTEIDEMREIDPDLELDNDNAQDEGPAIQRQDWDAVRGADILPEPVPEDGEFAYDLEKEGDLPEEDDDNPYQDSDEALPEDEEEAAIARRTRREGGFDET
ncbi:hypothetical protein [Mesorhizobium sp. dw_380]|uniref:hypothetical protein n=1 Tax=Mesorhizobium sp. dw_380 TaxID=2812001 RepID=UPI001BDED17A|nr:hypothetical protein [Mesorhizobium sp. dw_380]